MNRVERLLAGFAGLLLAAVVTGAAYIGGGQGQEFSRGHIPVSVIFGQLISQLAPSSTLAGLGILVGLLFARGLRWHTRADAEDVDADPGASPSLLV